MSEQPAVAIATVVTYNRMQQALALYLSVKQSNPGTPCFVYVIDHPSAPIPNDDPQLAIRDARDLPVENWQRFVFQYAPFELACSLKPIALQALLSQGFDYAIWLDADMQVYAPLTELTRPVRPYSLCLTPHLCSPLPSDGLTPRDEHMLASGIFNAGMVAASNCEEASRFLQWWGDKCYRECIQDVAGNRFVDQRWLDLAPGLLPNLFVHRRTGFHAAYWNIFGRNITSGPQGEPLLDNEPLVIFHYTGIDQEQPLALSKHQSRIELDKYPVLAKLLHEYWQRLKRCDDAGYSAQPYRYATLDDGTPISRTWREAIRSNDEELNHIEDPFSTESNHDLRNLLQLRGWKYRKARLDWKLEEPLPHSIRFRQQVERTWLKFRHRLRKAA